MRRKYLPLLLMALVIVLPGCEGFQIAAPLSGVTILDYVLGERWDGNAFVTGHARNDTNEEIDWVEFTAWYYDAFGVLISRHRSLIDDIPEGTTFEFEVRSSVPRAHVARFDIEVTDVIIYEK